MHHTRRRVAAALLLFITTIVASTTAAVVVGPPVFSTEGLDPTFSMTYYLVNCQANTVSCPTCNPITIISDGPVGVAAQSVNANGWSMGVQSIVAVPGNQEANISLIRPMTSTMMPTAFFATWENAVWQFQGLMSFSGEKVNASIGLGPFMPGQLAGTITVQCFDSRTCQRQGASTSLWADNLSVLYRGTATATSGEGVVPYTCLRVYWASFSG